MWQSFTIRKFKIAEPVTNKTGQGPIDLSMPAVRRMGRDTYKSAMLTHW